MNRTIETGAAPELVIECKGDLEVEGHRRGELGVAIESDDEHASIVTDGDRIVISADGDTEVRAPQSAIVRIVAVGGDLELEGFAAAVSIGHVGGDLEVQAVGDLDVRNVGGDCELEDCAGVASVGSVGGDLDARDVAFAGRSVSVGGDVALRLAALDEPFTISAGGDVSLELSGDIHATVRIADSTGVRRVRFGEGTVDVRINAGGEVAVTRDGARGEEMKAQIGPGIGEAMREVEREMLELQRNIENMAREFSQRFAGVGVPDWKIERARRQAEAAARKMEAKLQHHMRRLEERARREAERAAARAARSAARAERQHGRAPFAWGGPPPPPPPPPADPAAMPFEAPPQTTITDEERLTILRMVQEKKITVEQAEQLLAALER